eukprot:XP_001709456.1 Hypothetical protein GL50803_27793 [Giardia lamblia ATCC 50803]
MGQRLPEPCNPVSLGRWQQEAFHGTHLPGWRGDPRAGPVPLHEHYDRCVPHDGHSGSSQVQDTVATGVKGYKRQLG